MAWSTSTDVRDFLAAAGDFLHADPVGNTMLLSEAAYLEACPPAADQLYGWWATGSGPVTAAFLRAPRHPPILSPLPGKPEEAVRALAATLPGVTQLGVDARDADKVRAAWPGVTLTEGFRVTLCRLRTLRPAAFPPGRPRRATPDDRDLLVGWFHDLMAADPGDPSDLAYVIDDPLSCGGLLLWEVDGVPVAMAGRSRVTAGMTRVSATYAPDGRTAAVFAAACAEADEVADDVLVLTTDVPAHEALGFEAVLDRVMLDAAR
ncbi:hypothetical protein [Paractinoplanes maris]|uniref:hypothetical protein n=1 Tax=Paractinoplanes maris TaxID=1734446 RepID=UPI0020228197|nr:hypothetical protein [Actinoplanes maris]